MLLQRPPRPSKPFATGWLALASSFLAVLAAPALPPSAPAGKATFEEWAVLSLGGNRCGYDSTQTLCYDTPGGVYYYTVQQQEFVVKRFGTALKILETSKTTEDADGGVTNFEEINEGAGSRIESSGQRDGDDMVVTSRGQTKRYHLPRLAAIGPEAVRRLGQAVPLQAGQRFSFSTFEDDYPQAPVIESGVVAGQETRPVGGKKEKVWKITSTTSLDAGIPMSLWVDDKNNDVESIIRVPGIGALDEVVSTREECMRQPAGAELFTTTLIRPQTAIIDPALMAEATYRITSSAPDAKLTLWNEGEQRVMARKPGSVEITVTVPKFTPEEATWRLPHADTPELHPYLQASAYLEVNAPIIRQLARQAVGTETNPVRAARKIQEFVRAYISKKDLRIGFASAEETANLKEGDCTEHAVLCAALGRAVGLPTRCVLGLGYIPPGVEEPTIANTKGSDTGIFGFHMWAEAWIGPDKWMAMDAALGDFDVGHIAITKSALEEVNPLVDLNLPILQLMEDIKIEVVNVVPKHAVAAGDGVD